MSERRACLPVRSAAEVAASPDGGGARAERMARYKEERRRQLAEQFGVRAEEAAGAASTPSKRYITRGGELGVRTTKTSRLRAAGASANTAATTTTTSDSGKESPRAADGLAPRVSPRHKDSSTSPAALRSPVAKEAPSPRLNGAVGTSSRTRRLGVVESTSRRHGTSTNTTTTSTTSSDHEPGPAQPPDAPARPPDKREKDKSSKRKSNLNRSLTEEVVVDDLTEEHVSRRRRRRIEVPAECLESLGRRATSRTSPVSPVDPSPRLARSPVSQEQPRGDAAGRRQPRASPEADARPLQRRLSGRCSEDAPARPLYSSTRLAGAPVCSPTRLAGAPVCSPTRLAGAPVCSPTRLAGAPVCSPTRLAGAPVCSPTRVAGSPFCSPTRVAGSPVCSPTRVMSPDNEVQTAVCIPSPELCVNGSFHTEDAVQDSNPVNVNGINSDYEAFVIDNLSSAKSSTRKHVIVKESEVIFREPKVSSLPSSLQHTASHRTRETSRSLSGSPVRHPSSILKKKSLDETHSSFHTPVHLVSILKRKPSRDSSSVSPVTFSPTVVDPASRRSKRQGILKKRASLDECEVMRRSCSPDIGSEPHDFKPILKHHRRSSLEELVRRTHSPDPQPQSILKRRTSREDELDDCGSASPEPQGILKRKSASSNSSNGSSASNSPHVSISSSVILAARIDVGDTSDSTEQVKPILKKKSSSEDSANAESSSEVPKPILKKKQSVDVEDLDDKPMKPILKTSRKSSQEERDSDLLARHVLLRGRSLGTDSPSGSDCEFKPILKQPFSECQQRERSVSPRHKLSFQDSRDTHSLDSPNVSSGLVKRRPRPASIVGVVRSNSSAIENELSTILNRRRSLEVENLMSQDPEHQDPPKPPDPVQNDVLHSEAGDLPPPSSVAERILTMESFLSVEMHKRNAVLHPSSGAVPKIHPYHRTGKSKDRFYTQPVTLEEIQASARLESVQAFQKDVDVDKHPEKTGLSKGPADVDSRDCSSPTLERAPSPVKNIEQQQLVSGDCEPMESDSGTTAEEKPEGTSLKRSDSVVARASMFAQLEEQMKTAAEEAKSRRLPRLPRGTVRHRGHNLEGATRYATQPVTCDELQEAVRQNQRTVGTSSSTTDLNGTAEDQEGRDEDDPSKLTLAERVRLFNQKIKEETLPKVVDVPVQRPLARKRVVSSRFKTQPVTTDEVDNAQRISTLAATLTKPPDIEVLGSLSAKAVKEKIYEHASKILSKQQLDVSKKTNVSTKVDEKPKGILKNAREGESKLSQNECAAVESDDTEEDCENEIKSILKIPPVSSVSPPAELENFRNLKSVLKKETDKDQHCEVISATNEHLRSILKQESKDWSAGDGSSPSSSEDSSSPSEEEACDDTTNVKKTAHLRGGKGMDLVSILHDVEATARQQRQANNKNSVDNEENLMNQRNLLLHEKETKNIRHSYQKARVAEISSKTIGESYNSKKIVVNQEHKSSVHRKVETRHEESQAVRKLVESPQGVKVVSSTRQLKSYEHKLHRQLDDVSSQNETTPPTSDGDTTSSSGGREVRQIISNEATPRRRLPPVDKYHKSRSSVPAQSELSKSKSHSAVATSINRNTLQVTTKTQSNRHSDVENHVSENFTGFIRDGIRRSFTQPMTNLEQKEAGDNEMNRTSIAERVAALQKSKEQDWRKRVPKTNPDEELICTVNNHLNAFPAERDEVVGGGSILADRKEKLDAAKQGWKKRVEPTDAVKFSVAGKMKIENKAADQSPTLPQQNGERRRRMPQRSRFRSKMAQLKEISSTPCSPQKEVTPTFKRSISAPSGDEEDLTLDPETMLNGLKVVVPRTDDETFTAFFRSASSEQAEKEQLQINDADLDLVISKSSQLSVQKRTVKVQRRHVASRNPIKALASRVDIQEEYLEVRTGVAEKELKRLNMEKLAKNSSFAVEALAGLASKEDFTSVALKKALPSSSIMLPYKDLMLLHVKGRRHVQTRLVEPSPSSINSGDSYVLVTPMEVFHWIGTYANVIERSRGAEVALHIQQKRDMGYCSAGSVVTIYEEKLASCVSSAAKKFWRLLGGDENSKAIAAGHPDEDELYESSIIDTNVVYEVEDDELVPMSQYIGSIPKIEMLDPSKILVFDFGSEMYVWNGKTAPLERRRVAQSLARELWAEDFDYSQCDVCPVTVAGTLGSRQERPDSSLLAGASRPEWALLAKVTQHMETILFREKFLDWPDFSRVIRSKDCDDTDKQVDASIDINPCDAGKMLEENHSFPDIELEGSHLGRGDTYFDEETHRHFEITTQGVTIWHVMEFESAQLPASSLGQFHSADSYVVRWTYSITVTGRELNGQPSRHSMAGRDRCAYFCWQGSEASLNEQGAAALLTVELDHERGPQVRVVQGAEPPAFLRLFQGAMIVHSGLRECEHVNHRKGWRLYVCRGERKEEASLVQVTCSVRSLRSRASFVLVRPATGAVYVWHGAKTRPHTQKTAMSAAEHLKKRPLEMEFPEDAEITITVQHEGSESTDFFTALGGSNRQLYVSLQKDGDEFDYSPRLFHLSSLSGTFSATEVLSPLRDRDTVVAYPFLQTDLYSASQPALFLLDNHSELWLWQGWWPDFGEESSLDNSFVRGSRAVLWQMERRAAMQTALDYWQLKHGLAPPRAYLVWAGLEPLHFTNLFPTWTDRDDIAELIISDGRKPGELLTVEGELARLTRSTYPAAQLLQRPLPDGVDPTRLELYLEPSHFQELLGMTKEEFLDLPTWKQTNVKKEVGLF